MKYLKIKKNSDFQRLFGRGKKVFSPYLSLLYFKSDKLKMGIAVSKKHGNAVTRNRVKRLVRAAFSDTCALLEKPCDLVVIPKILPDGNYSFHDFKKGLEMCFSRINKELKNA